MANVSTGGIGLVLDEPVPLKTFMKIEIKHRGTFHMLMARVAHVTPGGQGWLVGCQFTRRLTNAQLRELLAD